VGTNVDLLSKSPEQDRSPFKKVDFKQEENKQETKEEPAQSPVESVHQFKGMLQRRNFAQREWISCWVRILYNTIFIHESTSEVSISFFEPKCKKILFRVLIFPQSQAPV
jgi:hypothetical protein